MTKPDIVIGLIGIDAPRIVSCDLAQRDKRLVMLIQVIVTDARFVDGLGLDVVGLGLRPRQVLLHSEIKAAFLLLVVPHRNVSLEPYNRVRIALNDRLDQLEPAIFLLLFK